jgi:hypothetical protein
MVLRSFSLGFIALSLPGRAGTLFVLRGNLFDVKSRTLFFFALLGLVRKRQNGSKQE